MVWLSVSDKAGCIVKFALASRLPESFSARYPGFPLRLGRPEVPWAEPELITYQNELILAN